MPFLLAKALPGSVRWFAAGFGFIRSFDRGRVARGLFPPGSPDNEALIIGR
jgi:hypothetical protein